MKKTSLLLVLSSLGLLLTACGEESSSPAATTSEEPSEELSSEVSTEESTEESTEDTSEFSLDPAIFGENAQNPFEEYIVHEAVIPSAKHIKLGTSVSIFDDSYRHRGLLVTVNEGNNVGFFSIIGQKYIIPNSLYPGYLNYYVTQNSHIGFILRVEYKNVATYYDPIGNVLAEGHRAGIDTFQCTTTIVDDVLYYEVTEGVGFEAEPEVTFYKLKADGTLEEVESIPTPEEPEEEYEGPEIGDKVDFGNLEMGSDFGAMDLGEFDEAYTGWHLHWNRGSFYTVNAEGEVVARFYVDVNSLVGWNCRGLVAQKRIAVGEEDEVFDYIDGGNKYVLKHYVYDVITGDQIEVDLDLVITNVLPYLNESGVYGFGLLNASRIDPETKRLVEGNRTFLTDGLLNILEDVTAYAPAGFVKLPNGNFINQSTMVLYDKDMKEICSLGAGFVSMLPDAGGFLCRLNGKIGFVDYNGKAKTKFIYDEVVETDGKYAMFRKGTTYVSADLVNGTDVELIPHALTRFVAGEAKVFRGYGEDNETLYFYDIAGNKLAILEDAGHKSQPFNVNLGLQDDGYLLDRLPHIETTIEDLITTKTNYEEIAIGTFANPFDKIVTKGTEVVEHITDGSTNYPYTMVLGENTFAQNVNSYTTYFEFSAEVTAYYQVNFYDEDSHAVYDDLDFYEKIVDEETGDIDYTWVPDLSYWLYDYDEWDYTERTYRYRAALLEAGKTYRVALRATTAAYGYFERTVTLERSYGRYSAVPEIGAITATSKTMDLKAVREGGVYGRFTVAESGIYEIDFGEDPEVYEEEEPELRWTGDSPVSIEENKYYLQKDTNYSFVLNVVKDKTATLTFTGETEAYDLNNPFTLDVDGQEHSILANSRMNIYGVIPAADNVNCNVRVYIDNPGASGHLYWWTDDINDPVDEYIFSNGDSVELLLEAGQDIHFSFVNGRYSLGTTTFTASVVATTPAFESQVASDLYLVGKGSFVTGGEEGEWATDGGILLHEAEDENNRASILNLSLQKGDLLKFTNGLSDEEAEWLGWEAMGAEFNPVGRANFAREGNDNNIKVLVSGIYDIYINGESKIYIVAHNANAE